MCTLRDLPKHLHLLLCMLCCCCHISSHFCVNGFEHHLKRKAADTGDNSMMCALHERFWHFVFCKGGPRWEVSLWVRTPENHHPVHSQPIMFSRSPNFQPYTLKCNSMLDHLSITHTPISTTTAMRHFNCLSSIHMLSLHSCLITEICSCCCYILSCQV